MTEKTEKILGSWVERINTMAETEAAENPLETNKQKEIISICYPEIFHYIMGGTDKEVINWIKNIVSQGHPAGFPLKYFAQGHSVLREIIIEEVWASKKERT